MKLHSVIDSITNSSTSVYIWPVDGAIEEAKTFLQSILSVLNPEAKVEDYFEFYYTLGLDILDYEDEEIEKMVDQYLVENEIDRDEYDNLDWDEQKPHQVKITEKIAGLYNKGEFPYLNEIKYEEAGIPFTEDLTLMVKPINGEAFDLWEAVCKIFDYTASSY